MACPIPPPPPPPPYHHPPPPPHTHAGAARGTARSTPAEPPSAHAPLRQAPLQQPKGAAGAVSRLCRRRLRRRPDNPRQQVPQQQTRACLVATVCRAQRRLLGAARRSALQHQIALQLRRFPFHPCVLAAPPSLCVLRPPGPAASRHLRMRRPQAVPRAPHQRPVPLLARRQATAARRKCLHRSSFSPSSLCCVCSNSMMCHSVGLRRHV